MAVSRKNQVVIAKAMTVLPKDALYMGVHIAEAKYLKHSIGISASMSTGDLMVQYKGRSAYLPIRDYVAATMVAIENEFKNEKRRKGK